MNMVKEISLFFSGKDKAFFQAMYANWDLYWTNELAKSTDRILKKYDDASYVLELDVLKLELGSISTGNFKRYFLPKYEEALENALIKSIQGSDTRFTRKTKINRNKSELLFHFLLHGSFLWNTIGEIKNLDALFIEVATYESEALKIFFQTYGHYSGLQQRLILQFDEKSLKKGIHTIASADSHFILSYVEFIQSKYQQLRSPSLTHTSHRKAVWSIVYAYLLTNRSTFFNKKSFLEQTIRQFANRYLITYSALLNLLLLDIKEKKQYPYELLKLLTSLKEEESNSLNEVDNWKKWINLLTAIEQEQSHHLIAQKSKLIISLKSNQNYLFLKSFSEIQILKIVEAIVPEQYPFIKTYAHELDQQKDHGMLQGKAGGEFRLVKWQIIFPILLDHTETGFNRKYFVERVLHKIAAHYNLKFEDLLEYLQSEVILKRTDRELFAIFKELSIEFITEKKLHQKTSEFNISQIIPKLHEHLELSFELRQEWLALLKNETVRNRLLEQLSEKEHYWLINTLYQRESVFILSYAQAIEQQKDKGILQGKTSGGFQLLKWKFIYIVLLEPKHQVFNKRYFVERVLQKIAAHHNLKTEELVTFFYMEMSEKGFTLPFELIKILEILYKENDEKYHLQEKKRLLQEEKEEISKMLAAEQLLVNAFGKENDLMALIRQLAQQTEFIRFIEPVLQIEIELRLFIYKHLNVSIDKKRLLQVLLRFSMIYTSFSKTEILQKIIILMLGQLKDEKQHAFEQQLEKVSIANPLLKQSLVLNNLNKQEHKIIKEELLPEMKEQPLYFISNAGLVLLTPFLPRLFSMLQLTTADGSFKDIDAQTKAVFLLQYVVFGETEAPEHELQLNKLLTDFKTGIPIPRSITLTEEEIKTAESMLHAVIQHWTKIKTIDGLREGFLQREGKLEEKEEVILLTVENKAFDMLLDTVPWSFQMVKFKWMKKAIQVKWR